MNSVSRRDFLIGASAVGAAAFLNPMNAVAKVIAPASLPKGVSKGSFTKACTEYRKILGSENVIIDVGSLVPYSKIMIPSPNIQHQPMGALIVHSVEQIQKVLAVCNRYKIPVWPISTGRNIGYGSAAPATPGQLVLDMRNMNKIIEIDPELCTALIEPGVTYRQLVDYIDERKLNLWVSFPSSGGLSGPMGNILDRGVGYNRNCEHFSNFSGLEVVLPDGEILRTGLGGVKDSPAWQSYRWGFGPWVDGLFSQSNYGVVTKMGIWLMQKPPGHQAFTIGWDDVATMAKGVDVARQLRLDNIIENGVVGNTLYGTAQQVHRSEIYQGSGAIPEAVLAKYFADKKMPRWGFVACLYGTPEQLAINSKIVKERFENAGGKFRTGKDLEGDTNAAHMERVMTGTLDLTEFGLYNFRGGGGSAWLAPAVPARAADVTKSYTITSEIFHKHGFDYVGGFLMGVRHTEHVVDLLFDRTNPEESERAHHCFQEALAANAAAGYGVYRTNTGFMDQAAESYGPAQRAFNKKIKRALDPNGIIAPGKSGIHV